MKKLFIYILAFLVILCSQPVYAIDLISSGTLTVSAVVAGPNDNGNGNEGGNNGNGGSGNNNGNTSTTTSSSGAPVSEYVAPTSVVFSGSATPFSIISLLKDGQIIKTLSIGADSKFTISIDNNLTTGNYIFSLTTEDSLKNKSNLFTASLYITSGTITTVSGIILNPNEVNNIEVENEKCNVIGDLNGDCQVNLADFSILKYWHEKSGFPKKYDLNNDGVINMADFSILAYHWTG